jgi:hypothetical protein
MGFNIEQYGLNDNYSNILGIGSGKWKSALGIGDGKIFGKVVNPTKNAQYEANKYVTSGQKAIDEQKAIDDEKAQKEQTIVDLAKKVEATKKANAEAKAKIDAGKKSDNVPDSEKEEKSKTMLYVGIGAGVLILGTIITFLIIKRNK